MLLGSPLSRRLLTSQWLTLEQKHNPSPLICPLTSRVVLNDVHWIKLPPPSLWGEPLWISTILALRKHCGDPTVCVPTLPICTLWRALLSDGEWAASVKTYHHMNTEAAVETGDHVFSIYSGRRWQHWHYSQAQLSQLYCLYKHTGSCGYKHSFIRTRYNGHVVYLIMTRYNGHVVCLIMTRYNGHVIGLAMNLEEFETLYYFVTKYDNHSTEL